MTDIIGLGERLYTEKEFTRMTGICRATLHNLRKKGELGFYRFGRSIRYGERHLQKFLAHHLREDKTKSNR